MHVLVTAEPKAGGDSAAILLAAPPDGHRL